MFYVAIHEAGKAISYGEWFGSLCTRGNAEFALVHHAVMTRYVSTAEAPDLPKLAVDDDHSFCLYFRLQTRMMRATFLDLDWPSPASGLAPPRWPDPLPHTVLCIDDSLRVVAASGDEHGGWGPFWAAIEARDAAEERWYGPNVPLALHAENHEGRLHVLWREGEVLAAADTDPARWDSRWETVQNWMVTKHGPKLHLFSPPAWYDLRVRPVGPARPRQRHVGAVTA